MLELNTTFRGTLNEAIEFAHSTDRHTKSMFIETNDIQPVRDNKYALSIRGEELGLTRPAYKQFLSSLGIPYKYGDICDNDLLAYNVMCRLNSIGKKEIQVRRFDDGNTVAAKAFLSPSYTTIPNGFVMENIKELLRGQPEFLNNAMVYADLTDTRAAVNIEADRNIFKQSASVGDDFSGGISFVNSDTGNHSLSFMTFILRLICSNGAVSSQNMRIFRTIHRGLPNQIMERANEAIEQSKLLLPQMLQRIAELKQTPLTDNINEQLQKEMIAATSVDAVEATIKRLPIDIEEVGKNKYAFYNAATFVGTHNYDINPDLKFDIKKFAGTLIRA